MKISKVERIKIDYGHEKPWGSYRGGFRDCHFGGQNDLRVGGRERDCCQMIKNIKQTYFYSNKRECNETFYFKEVYFSAQIGRKWVVFNNSKRINEGDIKKSRITNSNI